MRVERKWRLIHLPWWFKFFADLVKSRPGIRVLALRVSGCWAFIQFLGFICDSSRHEMHPPFVGGEFVQGSVVVSCCCQVIANLLLSVSKDRACGKLSSSEGWVPATLETADEMKWTWNSRFAAPKSPADLFFSFNLPPCFLRFPLQDALVVSCTSAFAATQSRCFEGWGLEAGFVERKDSWGIQITITSSGATCKKFMDLKSCLYIFLWVFYWRFDFCEGLAHLNRNGQGHSLTKAQWQGQLGVLRSGVGPRFSGVASLLWIFTNLKVQSFQFLICWTSSWESWELPKKCVCWGGQQVGLLIWLHCWVSLCLYSTISRSTMSARSCVVLFFAFWLGLQLVLVCAADPVLSSRLSCEPQTCSLTLCLHFMLTAK